MSIPMMVWRFNFYIKIKNSQPSPSRRAGSKDDKLSKKKRQSGWLAWLPRVRNDGCDAGNFVIWRSFIFI
ncbi:MAG: hypothetical protein NTX00_00570 [Candidatus Parcubacteria bacterium]|nr:hypothetical protein [Candidatus Parcubacteria bacterium]